MFKKFLSVAMVLVMLIGVMPTVSLAATLPNDEFGVNYIFDDFQDGIYDTDIWRNDGNQTSGNGTLTIETVEKVVSDGNKAIVLNCPDTSSTTMFMLEDDKGLSLTGDVVLEFDMCIISNTHDKKPGYMTVWFGNTGVALMKLRSTGDNRVTIPYGEDATGMYVGNKTDSSVWHHFRYIFHTDDGTFSVWADNTNIIDNQSFNGETDVAGEAFTALRFQLSKASYKIALDNIKVGKHLNFKQTGFVNESDSTIYATADGVNKYKAQVLNNSSMDSKATIVMAAYDNTAKELKKVYTNEVTLTAGRVTDVVAALDGVDPSWDIKVFFVDSMSAFNPLRKSFGDVYDELPATAQAVASTRTVEISASEYSGITPTYPDGKYKAVTVRCDDGYASDRDLIEIFDGAGIKGTFYVCEKNIGAKSTSITESELKTLYLDAGHEIANHTANHLKMNSVIDASVDSDAKYTFDPYIKNDIKQGKDYLENTLGIKINGFTAPYSSDYKTDISYLAETGHTYAVRNQYNKALSDGTAVFDLPDISNVYDIKATLRDMFIDGNGNDAINYADAYLALDEKEMSLFFLWGHSGDFNSYGDSVSDANKENGYPMTGNSGVTYGWEFARTLYTKLGGKSDIWYATNGDIFHYLFAHEDAAVEYGTGSHRIYNPSNTITLCFDLGSQFIEVAPKETVIINVK